MTIEDRLVFAEEEFRKFRISLEHVEKAGLELAVARRTGRKTLASSS